MKCYCKERKGHWYFRMRVPEELHPYLPSEISYSIKGLDLETARFIRKLPWIIFIILISCIPAETIHTVMKIYGKNSLNH